MRATYLDPGVLAIEAADVNGVLRAEVLLEVDQPPGEDGDVTGHQRVEVGRP